MWPADVLRLRWYAAMKTLFVGSPRKTFSISGHRRIQIWATSWGVCVCDTKGEILSQEPDHLFDQQLRDLQMEGDVQDPWFGKDILVGRVIVVDAMAAHKGVSLIQCVPSHSSNGTVVQGDLQGCIVKSWSSAVNDVLQVSISRHHLGQPIVWEEAE